MARKSREEAERTYHALLQAAARLFRLQGVGVTTLNEIAKEAGVTRGALYWHFEGKDDVIRSLWASYAAPKLSPLEERLENLPSDDPVAAFRQIQHDFLRMVLEDEQLGLAICIVVLNVEATQQQTALQSYLLEEKVRLSGAFEKAFIRLAETGATRPGQPPDRLTRAFLAYMTGLLDQHFSPIGNVDLAKEGEALLEVFFEGVFGDRALRQPDLLPHQAREST